MDFFGAGCVVGGDGAEEHSAYALRACKRGDDVFAGFVLPKFIF